MLELGGVRVGVRVGFGLEEEVFRVEGLEGDGEGAGGGWAGGEGLGEEVVVGSRGG